MALSDVVRGLNAYQRFLVTTHEHPDGDAVGSLLAMTHLLRTGLGKYVIAVTPDPIPPRYQFMPGLDMITSREKAAGMGPYDAIVTVDVSTKERIRDVADLIEPSMKTINIDHHVTNPQTDDISWVDTKAAATSEMMFDLLQAMKITPGADISTALYTGIITDTGQFAFSGTTAKAVRTAADLISYGADFERVAKEVYRTTQEPVVRVLGKVLTRMEMHDDDRLAISWMEPDEVGVDHEGFVNHMLDIDTVEVAVFMRPLKDGEYKLSLRSAGKVDVAELAKEFGGGGHAMAAGGVIDGGFERAHELAIERSVLAIKHAISTSIA